VRLASWGSLDFVPFVHSVHFARELQAYPPCTSDFCRHCALLFQLWCVLKEVGVARRGGALLRERKKRLAEADSRGLVTRALLQEGGKKVKKGLAVVDSRGYVTSA
jgi:hypothetical protein